MQDVMRDERREAVQKVKHRRILTVVSVVLLNPEHVFDTFFVCSTGGGILKNGKKDCKVR